jgi:hypothetical protein
LRRADADLSHCGSRDHSEVWDHSAQSAIPLRYPQIGAPGVASHLLMAILHRDEWALAAWLTPIVAVAAVAAWLVFRKRPSAEEIERARREFLVHSGRLVDGMLLDIYDVDAKDGRILPMLLFNYRIAGVDYECSQDISAIQGMLNPKDVRAGFPCTVRYQPGNPQNSIVLAEGWTGLREGLPQLPAYDDPDPLDKSDSQSGDE